MHKRLGESGYFAAVRKRLPLTDEHSGVGDNEKRAATCNINKHGCSDGHNEIEDLETSIYDGFSFGISDTDTLQDNIDVIGHKTISTIRRHD